MTVLDDAEILVNTLIRLLGDNFAIEPLSPNECVLVTPFSDPDGDPIKITIGFDNGLINLDDMTLISGQLFALGQHTDNTPAFKLLTSLAKAYDCDVDFDEGLVRKRNVRREAFYENLTDLAKVIITMLTATPHIRMAPQRMRILGPRLRKRIREKYKDIKLLTYVESDREIPGVAVENWPVDFHWQISKDQTERNVYVIAADLDTQEPLRKAERLCALATDTQARRKGDHLRIVIDTHGRNSESTTATQFLQHYSEPLNYVLYDFGDAAQQANFLRQSANEVLGEVGNAWRLFWHQTRASASS